jgi:hypothetical protein
MRCVLAPWKTSEDRNLKTLAQLLSPVATPIITTDLPKTDLKNLTLRTDLFLKKIRQNS